MSVLRALCLRDSTLGGGHMSNIEILAAVLMVLPLAAAGASYGLEPAGRWVDTWSAAADAVYLSGPPATRLRRLNWRLLWLPHHLHSATAGTEHPGLRAALRVGGCIVIMYAYVFALLAMLYAAGTVYDAVPPALSTPLLILFAPWLAALAIVAFEPGPVITFINSKSLAISRYYERNRGRDGFFYRWALRPALWLQHRLFHAVDAGAMSEPRKAAIRLVAWYYLAALVVVSIEFIIALIIGGVLLVIALFIIGKAMGGDDSGSNPVRTAGGIAAATARTRKRSDFWGDAYDEHIKGDGRTAGTSRAKKDFWGDKYTEHLDADGNKTGESREKKDFWGDRYEEHRDADGNRTGKTESRKDLWGDSYDQHNDADGNIVGESREKRDFWGDPYTEHKPKD